MILNPYIQKDYYLPGLNLTGIEFRKNSSTQSMGQNFIATSNYSLSLIELFIIKVGTPSGTITLNLYEDEGLGNLTLLETSTAINVSSLPTEFGIPLQFIFTPTLLQTNSSYRIVLTSTVSLSSSHYLLLGSSTSLTSLLYFFNGSTWNLQNNISLNFITYGLRCFVKINFDSNILSNNTSWYNLVYENNFNTALGIIVQDINNVEQTGLILDDKNLDNEIIFEYDYYNNTQSNLASGVDKDIVLLVEGVNLNPSKTNFTIKEGINSVVVSASPIQYFTRQLISSFIYEQNTASSTWIIDHNLETYPSVTIVDTSGNIVIGNVQYNSNNQLTLTFNPAFAGKAYLR